MYKRLFDKLRFVEKRLQNMDTWPCYIGFNEDELFYKEHRLVSILQVSYTQCVWINFHLV
jgi:hypothetical protein